MTIWYHITDISDVLYKNDIPRQSLFFGINPSVFYTQGYGTAMGVLGIYDFCCLRVLEYNRFPCAVKV